MTKTNIDLIGKSLLYYLTFLIYLTIVLVEWLLLEQHVLYFVPYFLSMLSFPLIVLFSTTFKSKLIKLLIAISWTVFQLFYISQFFYYVFRKNTLDVNFVYSNRTAIFKTFSTLFGLNFVVLVLLLYFFIMFFTYLLLNSENLNALKRYLLFFILIGFTMFFVFPERNTLSKFIYFNYFNKSELREIYYKNYLSFIREKIQKRANFNENMSVDGILENNLIILQLESLNSYLVDEELTPNMIEASKKGIFIQNGFSHTVQTLRSQEIYLCGIPPSLDEEILFRYSNEEIGNMNCLPRMFRNIGFETYMVFIGDPDFSSHSKVSLAMGFNNLLSKNIMNDDDPKVLWGYREDIFYKRIGEFFDRMPKEKKFFMHITSGSTNHIPYDALKDPSVKSIDFPIKNPIKFEDTLRNSAFLQDYYLKVFLDYYFEKLNKNTSMFIFPDTSYPIGIHKGNLYNEAGVFEENFIIPIVFIPSENLVNKFNVNSKIEDRVSLLDIHKTILDIYGSDSSYVNESLGVTFKDEFLNFGEVNDRDKLDFYIQPFDGGGIGIIEYPTKYLYEFKNDSLIKYNLEKDPYENSPEYIPNPDIEEYKSLLDKIFR